MSKFVTLHGFGGGSGGTELNFEVVGGTTAPNNPKENMIWVNTSTTISSWAFSSTQPTAASGRVWISTDTSSTAEFNALKKNGIQVYPMSAKQYISGAWVDKTAKSYQGGKWVDWWNGELYKNGNEYKSITGGWVAKAFPIDPGLNTEIPTVNKKDNSIEMTIGEYSGGIVYTAKKINLSKYSNLIAKGTFTGDTTYVWHALCVWTDISGGGWQGENRVAYAALQGTKNQAIVDVSALSGEYYIGFGLYHTSSNSEMTEMYLV